MDWKDEGEKKYEGEYEREIDTERKGHATVIFTDKLLLVSAPWFPLTIYIYIWYTNKNCGYDSVIILE